MKRGFSLVEVLVSMVVMSVGLLGLASIFPIALTNMQKAREYTRTIAAAEQKLEELRSLAYTSPELDPTTFDDPHTEDIFYDVINGEDVFLNAQWWVTEDYPMEGIKYVVLQVQSPNGMIVNLETFINRRKVE